MPNFNKFSANYLTSLFYISGTADVYLNIECLHLSENNVFHKICLIFFLKNDINKEKKAALYEKHIVAFPSASLYYCVW